MSITVTVTSNGVTSATISQPSIVNTTLTAAAQPTLTASSGDTINVSVSTAGAIGPQGPQGPPSTTITVGSVSTLSAGSSATVVGTSSNNGANLSLAFGIPAGPTGATGAAGATGTMPTITATASTLTAGSSATVTATPSNGGANVALAFGIPRGADGTGGGSSNVTLSDATPSALGTAAPGTSTLASRSDHAHNLPVISFANLSGVPANFPTNTTLVFGLSASYSAVNHAHNYVQSLNNLTGNLTLAAGSNVTLTANGSTLTVSSAGGLTANDSLDGGDYVGQIVYSATIAISQQPQNQTASNAAATFSVVGNLSPAGNLAYQWQRSSDAGSSWLTVIGATEPSVSLTNLTYSSDNGNQYRVVLSASGASSVTSQSATLTVIDSWSGSGNASSKWTTTTNFLSQTFTAASAGVLYIDYTFSVNSGSNAGFAVLRNGTRKFGVLADSSTSGSVNSSIWTTFSIGDTITIRRESVVNNTTAIDTAGGATINSMSLWIS